MLAQVFQVEWELRKRMRLNLTTTPPLQTRPEHTLIAPALDLLGRTRTQQARDRLDLIDTRLIHKTLLLAEVGALI
jgi:hypothetical protein